MITNLVNLLKKRDFPLRWINLIRNKSNQSFVLIIMMVLCFASFGTLAQSSVASINQKVVKATNDKERLAIYKNAVRTNELEQTDSLIKLLEEGIALFSKHNYTEGKADLQISMGFICSKRRLLDISEENLHDALLYYESVGNKLKIAEIHNLLGVVEGRRLRYDKAISNFLYALDIFEKEKSTNGMVSSYIKLGVANELNRNHTNALSYYKKGVLLLGNDTINTDYININNNLGTLYGRLEKYDTAYSYFLRALRASTGSEYIALRILSLNNLGNVLKEKGNLLLAAQYYQEALSLAQKQNTPEDIIRVKINLATLQSLSDPAKAEITYREALAIAQQIEDKNFETDILNGIVEVYRAQGRFEEALALNDRREEIEDSLFNLEKAAEIANLELGYELGKTNDRLTEVKLSEERTLKQRNTIQIVAILLGFSFLCLLFFFWKLKQLNRKLRLHEKELQAANHTKDMLFSIIGHDLRNPITNMLLVLELLIEKKYEASFEDEILHKLREDSIATLQTLDNLLKWGSTQLNGVVVNPTTFYATDLIAIEFKQLINIARQKGITTINDVPEGVEVFMDKEHYKFIVRNLVNNAIKFTPHGGMVRFSAGAVNQGFQVFSVSDNGVGISDERKATLFEHFGISEYGTENEKGNGLGLMLCKLFVQQNGGNIWVENNPEGKGSVFFFSVKVE